MKKNKTIMCLLSIWVMPLVLLIVSAAGGQYEINWSTIDGGGGRSSGGGFTLTGTIGQPDAAYSAGGDYELLGGFWFILECLSTTAAEYNNWAYWDKPDCWCYARQCRGDADGLQQGPFWVSLNDLILFRTAVSKMEPQLRLVPNGICTDFDHQKQGPFWVSLNDLIIFRQYVSKMAAMVPLCDRLPMNTGPYNFWKSL